MDFMPRTNKTNSDEIDLSIQDKLARWDLSNDENETIAAEVIGLRLKRLRLLRNKTQTRVAKKINVSFQQLQKYEKGLNECRFINIIKLSEYLGVDVDYFYKPLVENNLKFLTKRERNGYADSNRTW